MAEEESLRIVFSKEPYLPSLTPQKISKIEFAVQSATEIEKGSETVIYESKLYKMPERIPHEGSVLDTRLGVSSKTGVCATCHQKLSDCTGHFGHIRLLLPLFHIGYLSYTLKILQVICKTCSRVLLTPTDKEDFRRILRSPKLDQHGRKAVFKKIHTKCADPSTPVTVNTWQWGCRCKSAGSQIRICPYCGNENAVVKKASGVYKITHDKYKPRSLESQKAEFENAILYNNAIERLLSKVTDDLNPLRVLHLFQSIPQEDVEFLCLGGRPEDLITTVIPVPPVCIRPSVEMEGVGSNEDDISMRLSQILDYNSRLRAGFEQGIPASSVVEIWDAMQIELAVVLNSDLPGLSPLLQPQRRVRGYVQRLKGKSGRFRGNLSGKRVDFSGRTVISPDPNLGIDELAVPLHIAKMLTYPENVNHQNRTQLQQCILNGQFVHPGANLVEKQDGGKFFLKFADRRKIARELRPGDIVERHLRDGDVVLFNRQPSLHRVSMMAHKAKVRPWRTLRFNECVCSPYNADFDGDEMNVHLPQTEEAKAEALMLMGTEHNLCAPKNGELLVSATQDFLTCAYLITSKDVYLTRAQFAMYCCFMLDAKQEVRLPHPTIVKPIELWTGKQLFNVLLRPNARCKIFINVEVREKFCGRNQQHLCPKDGYVHFVNSEHISGRLGKVALGGNQGMDSDVAVGVNRDVVGGLFGVLYSDYGGRAAAEVMKRLSKLSARFMGERGFSIGIDDVTPSKWLQEENRRKMTSSYQRCDAFIEDFKSGKLIADPGLTEEETLEAKVTSVLNEIRSEAGKLCLDSLNQHNSCLIMSLCGSKGSPINIAQMIACVGQQTVNGTRTPNGFTSRSLPHFPRGDKTPQAKGFVASSFYSGLTPTEFFFHTMAGREGLVDTAVKTAETGYMSRRLIKALEDLYVHYDLTVRDASSAIVQLRYGDDALDPQLMQCKDGDPIDFKYDHRIYLRRREKELLRRHLMGRVRSLSRKADLKDVETGEWLVPLPGEMKTMIDEFLKDSMEGRDTISMQPLFSDRFQRALKSFLYDKLDSYVEARQWHGLSNEERGDERSEDLACMKGITRIEFDRFVRSLQRGYASKMIHPGTTVGAIAAQSIGEPGDAISHPSLKSIPHNIQPFLGTQMTLKTFHFAGVASMQITQGVPRIKEIINASKNISTPIIHVALESKDNPVLARIIKSRIEATKLSQVTQSMKTTFTQYDVYIEVKLDVETIAQLQLEIDAYTVRDAILNTQKLKIEAEDVHVESETLLFVDIIAIVGRGRNTNLPLEIHRLEKALPEVIVAGLSSVERAVIQNITDSDSTETHKILAEGTNLLDVMSIAGVSANETVTNHVMETERVLGIEAARSRIISEIEGTMIAFGIFVDRRHTMLLADCMTYKGEVLGITRTGISKMKDSVLHAASFEKTADHLFAAALHGRVDNVNGVSESIIMGIPMPTGTGLFKILYTDDNGNCLVKCRDDPMIVVDDGDG